MVSFFKMIHEIAQGKVGKESPNGSLKPSFTTLTL